ncbi:MAG: hypothetical protein GC149_01445 [Gammaproteobacteria bacterium]|nr:hypothetical protein [Gammaproteobacteria bacterium]
MDIRLTPSARKEVNEVADFYEANRPGLGTEFTDEFDLVYERIKLHPHAGTPFRNTYRQQLLNRFPYTVYYSISENEIVIFAVAHQHRKPGYWSGRVKESEGVYVSETNYGWPVTFEQVEEAQLRDMLKATPAQRLAMAEELMKFVNLAHSAETVKK